MCRSSLVIFTYIFRTVNNFKAYRKAEFVIFHAGGTKSASLIMDCSLRKVGLLDIALFIAIWMSCCTEFGRETWWVSDQFSGHLSVWISCNIRAKSTSTRWVAGSVILRVVVDTVNKKQILTTAGNRTSAVQPIACCFDDWAFLFQNKKYTSFSLCCVEIYFVLVIWARRQNLIPTTRCDHKHSCIPFNHGSCTPIFLMSRAPSFVLLVRSATGFLILRSATCFPHIRWSSGDVSGDNE
jgi:hypothetical protein